MHSIIIFKYVNLILWKKYILERIGSYFGGFGEKLNMFKDLGRKGKKYFQGAEKCIFGIK